jgi:carbonic anhydrase
VFEGEKTMRLIVFGLLLFVVNRAKSLTYSYYDTSNWPSGCTANDLQSPINITDAEYDKVADLSDKWPSGGATATAANAEQTIEITMDTPSQTYIRSIPTFDEQIMYYLEQVSFHWGLTNDTGSPHSVEGVFYPLEIHFTFYNSEAGSFSAASNAQQGLVKYAVFYNLSETGTDTLNTILNNLNASSFYDNTTTVALSAINYTSLLPDTFKTKYFFYSGSKDHPDCTQNVLWLLANDTMPISFAQLQTLRSFNVTSSGPPLAPNFRATQKLGDRKVYRTFKEATEDAGPTGNSYILALFFIFSSLACVAIAVTSAVLKNRQYHVIEDVPH